MDMDVPVIKVASFENTDIPLLRKVAKTTTSNYVNGSC